MRRLEEAMKKGSGKKMVSATSKVGVKKVDRKQASGKKKVKFEFKGEPEQEVYIAGTFNDWNPGQLKLKETREGVYWTALLLSSGRHEYKFVVDGVWCIDPNCPEFIPNVHGSLNSVMIAA